MKNPRAENRAETEKEEANMLKPLCTLALLALATGCSVDQEAENQAMAKSEIAAKSHTSAPAMPKASAAIAVDGEGLRIFSEPGGSARAIPFGTDEATVISVVEKLRGKAVRERNEECGAGPIDFAAFGGFQLHFQDGKFGGWSLRENEAGGIGTANGIAIGSTRSALDATFPDMEIDPESTLGTEFYTGGDADNGISGLLDGTGKAAKITNLWAGVDCAFR
jgi:hypothetical protein